MTAGEIRKAKFESDNGSWECARWLQGIAAQLAELNERERLLGLGFDSEGRVIMKERA